jgi:hypothetical protein
VRSNRRITTKADHATAPARSIMMITNAEMLLILMLRSNDPQNRIRAGRESPFFVSFSSLFLSRSRSRFFTLSLFSLLLRSSFLA